MTQLVLCALASLCCVSCAGRQGPPHHPAAEMSARATAKVGLIDLVVADAERAERVRQVYLNIAALGHEFDVARARSMLQARSLAQQRAAQDRPADAALFEDLLAPPLAQGRALFDRYAALMLEARSLLSAQEFDTLNRVR